MKLQPSILPLNGEGILQAYIVLFLVFLCHMKASPWASLAILMIHLHNHVSSTSGHSCPMTRIMTTSEPHSPHSWSWNVHIPTWSWASLEWSRSVLECTYSHRITPWMDLARCYWTHGIAPQAPRVFGPSKTTSGHIYSRCRCSLSPLVCSPVVGRVDLMLIGDTHLLMSFYSPTHELNTHLLMRVSSLNAIHT
jgi:hypothetical protein